MGDMYLNVVLLQANLGVRPVDTILLFAHIRLKAFVPVLVIREQSLVFKCFAALGAELWLAGDLDVAAPAFLGRLDVFAAFWLGVVDTGLVTDQVGHLGKTALALVAVEPAVRSAGVMHRPGHTKNNFNTKYFCV